MNMVEPDKLRILDELNPGSPGIEDETVLEEPRELLNHRPIRKSLEPDSRPLNTNFFERRHFCREIGVREADVIDASALRAAYGRLRHKNELDAFAIHCVGAICDRLAAQLLAVPADPLQRARCRDVNVME